jgi:hypothetical protein
LQLNPEVLLDFRQILDIYFIKGHSFETPDLLPQRLFKVKDVPHLRGLSDAAAVVEPLPTVVSDRILGCIREATKHKVTANNGAGPSFACVAMDHDNVLWILVQKLLHCFTNAEQKGNCW